MREPARRVAGHNKIMQLHRAPPKAALRCRGADVGVAGAYLFVLDLVGLAGSQWCSSVLRVRKARRRPAIERHRAYQEMHAAGLKGAPLAYHSLPYLQSGQFKGVHISCVATTAPAFFGDEGQHRAKNRSKTEND